MTPTPHSRRDVLKGAVAIAAAASVGTMTARRARAQGSAAQARAQIDGVLRQAVDAKEVPGVVAMAATDKGVLYEGAFGLRALDQSVPMTFDTVFRIASMTKAIMKTENPVLSNDVNFFPGAQIRWGLGYMLNLQPGPNGRSAGTVSWGGIFNTYYWLDPSKRVTGLIMTQILPFADARAVKLYGQFERGVYEALKAV